MCGATAAHNNTIIDEMHKQKQSKQRGVRGEACGCVTASLSLAINSHTCFFSFPTLLPGDTSHRSLRSHQSITNSSSSKHRGLPDFAGGEDLDSD